MKNINERILVSVIIPTYNREELLPVAIDSVLQQTYKNIEIIVVDDGSTDDTKGIIEKYRTYLVNNKLKYVYQENQGVSSARNLGIKLSMGEYISFLDSDDYICPNKIELQLKCIIKNEADFCYCGHINVNRNDKVFYKSKINFANGSILENYIKNKTTPHTSSWLFKRGLFSSISFREGCSWGEDMEVFLKISFLGKACYVDDYLVKVNVDGKMNRLSNFSWDKIDEDVFICKQIWSWLSIRIENIQFKNKIEDAIFTYRIPARIIYHLIEGSEDKNEFFYYYKKYKKEIVRIGFGNGLRSLKLWAYYIRLKWLVYVERHR